MRPHFAIAIDGPAASGKSTLAKELARRLGLVMVNSGAMYRAVTWKLLEDGIDLNDRPMVVDALDSMKISCGVDGMVSTVCIDGTEPGEELRGELINGKVSAVAAIPEVRDRLVGLQREYLTTYDLVMEGRDIGTVVFPDTPYKIYVDADESVRAQRRVAVGEVDSVADRDRNDSERATAPLKVADGAAVLDTSAHTIESGVGAAIEILRQQGLEIREV